METAEFQRVAYTISNAIGGLIEAMGMQAKNQERLSEGKTIAYDDVAFINIVEDRGLHHNSLMTQLYGE